MNKISFSHFEIIFCNTKKKRRVILRRKMSNMSCRFWRVCIVFFPRINKPRGLYIYLLPRIRRHKCGNRQKQTDEGIFSVFTYKRADPVITVAEPLYPPIVYIFFFHLYIKTLWQCIAKIWPVREREKCTFPKWRWYDIRVY